MGKTEGMVRCKGWSDRKDGKIKGMGKMGKIEGDG